MSRKFRDILSDYDNKKDLLQTSSITPVVKEKEVGINTSSTTAAPAVTAVIVTPEENLYNNCDLFELFQKMVKDIKEYTSEQALPICEFLTPELLMSFCEDE